MRKLRHVLIASTIASTIALSMQSSAQSSENRAVRLVPPAREQIAAAVLPAPAELRGSATVLGYSADGHFATLRTGTGPLVCLASKPTEQQFHVACYDRSLEPFMARGRALRAAGVKGDQVDTVRFAEIRRGTLRIPKQPAALYQLTGPAGSFEPATGTAPHAQALFVMYVPYATARSLGVSERPSDVMPWLMDPGTPKAHVMFVPKM